MKFIILILLISIFITNIKSDVAKDPYLILNCQIFDQLPKLNSDFEPANGDISTGMVKTKLVGTSPTLASNDPNYLPFINGRLKNLELFPSWFNKNDTQNRMILKKLNLTLDSATNVYTFRKFDFFPIDKEGWDEDPNNREYYGGKVYKLYHNFHFCLKVNSRFTYQGTESFSFEGDDDVWVFIDKQLVLDLGGLHPSRQGVVDLSKLGLVVQNTYDFDFFYCERHTPYSNMKIQTDLQIFCAWKDICGVCQGDGSTCCNKDTTCNDNNPCTIDECPLPNTEIEKGRPISDYCQHTAKSCPASTDKCLINGCSTVNGTCMPLETVECTDKSNQCLMNLGCDSKVGCQYRSMCSGPCHTGKCSAGKCVEKTADICSDELGSDPCKVYSCSASNGGCQAKPKCPSTSEDPCTLTTCDLNGKCGQLKLNGTECNCGCKLNKCQLNNCDTSVMPSVCKPLPKESIDDSNSCTDDTCNGDTGEIKNIPKKCNGCTSCKGGSCIPVQSKCDDDNKCTIDECLINGNCTNKLIECESIDLCMDYICKPDIGCVATPKVCPNSGNCKIGYCEVGQCKLKDRACRSPSFCQISQCDEVTGCILFDKSCVPDNPKCQKGICVNATATEEGRCDSADFDPKPFICKPAAIISTSVVVGVTIAAAVVAGALIFGAKKGYDHIKNNNQNKVASLNNNPLYTENPGNGENPLYTPN